MVKIDWTALLFPLATRDAASHAVDVTDRGHTGPVKNGDVLRDWALEPPWQSRRTL